MPPNRTFSVQPHLPLWEGLNAIYCRASRRCLQRRKIMGARYPDQVGGHKPCVPGFVFELMSLFGTDYVLPRRWPLVSLVGTGPPRTEPKKGRLSEWPGECHGSRSVLSECRWSTRMGVRGHGFHGVGKVRYLCRVCVFNLLIAASSVMGTSSY